MDKIVVFIVFGLLVRVAKDFVCFADLFGYVRTSLIWLVVAFKLPF